MAQYTVKSGDSWARIAGDQYGNQRWLVELAKANGGTGRTLHPGEVIDLPDFDTAQNPTISQGDWNDITGANNFGGGSRRGGGYGGPPVPQIGSPTSPRPTAATTRPPVPQIAPFSSVGSQRRMDELPVAQRNQQRPGSTRQGNINAQRQTLAAASQRGASYTAMARAYGVQPGQRQTSTNVTPNITNTPTTAAAQQAALRQAVPYLFGSPQVERNQLQTALPYLFPVQPGQQTGNRNTAWNPANNRPNPKVNTVLDNTVVSYGTEGSPLTQAQFNRGAQYTGEAFEYFLTSQNRKQLPRFMTTDLANVMPFPKRAGVTPEDWLRGMGYEEFMPGRWRIMDPVSKYASGGGGRYSGGGGTGRTGGGGGGRGGGGYGGGGYSYGSGSNMPLVNWRIGI